MTRPAPGRGRAVCADWPLRPCSLWPREHWEHLLMLSPGDMAGDSGEGVSGEPQSGVEWSTEAGWDAGPSPGPQCPRLMSGACAVPRGGTAVTTGGPAEEVQGAGHTHPELTGPSSRRHVGQVRRHPLGPGPRSGACGTCCSRSAASFGLGHSRQQGEGYRSHSGLMNLRPGLEAPVQPL